MKLIVKIFSTLFILLAVSCSKEAGHYSDFNENIDLSDKPNYAISIENMNTYLSERSHSLKTRGAFYDIQPITEKNDTVLYIVNYENGWEVFSADKRAPRIFAKADSGSITREDFDAIPPLKFLYDAFVENVCYLKENPDLKPHITFIDSWEAINTADQNKSDSLEPRTRSGEYEVIQSHLLPTKWGQESPWNIRAPYTDVNLQNHCLTGCGPVAMAQLLYYLHIAEGLQYIPYEDSYTNKYIPTNSNYIHLYQNEVNFIPANGNSPSVWGSMPLDQYGTGSFEAVSTLMIDMGIASQSRYYSNSTSTNNYDMFYALLTHCNLTMIIDDVDFDVLSNMIVTNHYPAILLIGYTNAFDVWVYGHYVVADAMKNQYSDTNQLISRYVGFNWGYDGQYDNIWLNTDVISWTSSSYYNSVECMMYEYTLVN